MADEIKISIKDFPVPPPSKLMEHLYQNSELARQVLTIHRLPTQQEKEEYVKNITGSFEIDLKTPSTHMNTTIEQLYEELSHLEDLYQQYSQEQDWYDPEDETDVYFSYQEKMDNIQNKIAYINDEIRELKENL